MKRVPIIQDELHQALKNKFYSDETILRKGNFRIR